MDETGPADERVTQFLRAAANRAFWFTSFLISLMLFLVCLAVTLQAGIGFGEDGWVPILALFAVGLSGGAVLVSLIGFSLRNAEMYRWLRRMSQKEDTASTDTISQA